MPGGISKINHFCFRFFSSARIVLPVAMALLMIWTTPAPALNPEERLGLADYFFSRQVYDQAIAAYQTFQYFYPDHPRIHYAGFGIGLSFFRQAGYEQALEQFKRVAVESGALDPELAMEALFMVSQCHAAQGQTIPAVENLEHLLSSLEDMEIRDRAYYHLGWILLETAREIDVETIAGAAAYFNKISPGNAATYRLDDMREWLEWGQTSRQGPPGARKNPALAGSLAILPGAGYVYCGRFQDALVTFLFNGGMIWAAWEAFENDLPVLGTMVSFVGVGFYAGSIYGSISAAHKHNQRLSRLFVSDLNRIRVNILPIDQGRGIMTGVTVSF